MLPILSKGWWKNIKTVPDDKIEEQILYVKDKLNLNCMPTKRDIKTLNICGLSSAIERTGGFKKWGKQLGLSFKNSATFWTDEKIQNYIINIMHQLNITRMPSMSELLDVSHNNSLDDAIKNSYGYYGWANKLSLNIKSSETLLGINYQMYCKTELENKGYSVQDTRMIAPYDLIINKDVKIDVKSGCAYYEHGNRHYSFGINKKYPTCDIYIIYAINENKKDIDKTFIIPSKYLHITTLHIGEISKYNTFIDQWKYIDKYIEYYNSF